MRGHRARRYAPPLRLVHLRAVPWRFGICFYHCLPLSPPIVHRRHALAITIFSPSAKSARGVIDCAVRLLGWPGLVRPAARAGRPTDGWTREGRATVLRNGRDVGDRSRINSVSRRAPSSRAVAPRYECRMLNGRRPPTATGDSRLSDSRRLRHRETFAIDSRQLRVHSTCARAHTHTHVRLARGDTARRMFTRGIAPRRDALAVRNAAFRNASSMPVPIGTPGQSRASAHRLIGNREEDDPDAGRTPRRDELRWNSAAWQEIGRCRVAKGNESVPEFGKTGPLRRANSRKRVPANRMIDEAAVHLRLKMSRSVLLFIKRKEKRNVPKYFQRK